MTFDLSTSHVSALTRSRSLQSHSVSCELKCWLHFWVHVCLCLRICPWACRNRGPCGLAILSTHECQDCPEAPRTAGFHTMFSTWIQAVQQSTWNAFQKETEHRLYNTCNSHSWQLTLSINWHTFQLMAPQKHRTHTVQHLLTLSHLVWDRTHGSL